VRSIILITYNPSHFSPIIRRIGAPVCGTLAARFKPSRELFNHAIDIGGAARLGRFVAALSRIMDSALQSVQALAVGFVSVARHFYPLGFIAGALGRFSRGVTFILARSTHDFPHS
jgi:hypothetical protein